ncbi:PQQ-binding-like beta-propeller repeat protein [Fluviispira multicolorata]|uniref:PQQ-binding-like beta-propeller repeat protein n=1 Tax=Fluviispira multicolorata TaxID=2654512 RepID=A0A833N4F8_9BACT|nr:PQQ-binding-like beta-propeller repeat protein [Fluviispira multicolorata]KAB8027750.1 PQQ-binding-like beta-propeller repeat protein [Fluviispira multicolorata]
MNFLKICYVSVALSINGTVIAHPEIKLIKSHSEVQEVIGGYSPGQWISSSVLPTVVIPFKRTFSQFGGLTSENLFSLENQKEIKKSENNKTFLGIVKKNNFLIPRPICGASPDTNTINCFDLNKNAQYFASYPIPGALSTTPVFSDNSWLFGTTKGFLFKVEANPENAYLPKLGHENINFWGAYSRKQMSSFRPKPVYTEGGKISPASSNNLINKAALPSGIKWVFPASSELMGTPIVKNGFVYSFSASEYLQAIDWNTGKLAWATRLAPDSNLRMSSNALVVTSSDVIVGTELGTVLFLNPKSGAIFWSWQIPSANEEQRSKTKLPSGPDRFSGIIALPFVYKRNVIVSNAESMTQNLSLDSRAAIWSYPLGSVAQAKVYKDNVILGSVNGKIVSLNAVSGKENWTTEVLKDSSPIISLFLTKSGVILASSSRGQVFMVDPANGKILAQNLPIGEVNGEFFPGYDKAEACLSFSQEGFRCFYAKVTKENLSET